MLNKKQFKKIKEVTVNQYVHQIKTSEARNKKYFSIKTGRGRVKKLKENLPKKYQTIGTDLDGYWLGLDNKRIIANPKAAGTANYVPVNSQLFYSSVHHAVRNLVMAELHTYWENIFSAHAPFVEQEYPLFIWIDWYCTKEHKTQDIDNFTYIVEKSMFDALTASTIIPNDTVDYITGQASLFHKIDKFEDRKLVISFYTYTEPDQIKLL
jgi:hypothetical protein